MYLFAPIFLIPFFGWGVIALQKRLRYQEEFSILVEASTLLCLLLFYAFEMTQLQYWMQGNRILHIFSILGLLVFGAALYGHMIISLASRMIVEVVAPGDDDARDQPRFGPAEMLERQRDWEGALKEYLILARIYPKNPAIYGRIARVQLELNHPAEAAQWFERALRFITLEEHYLPAASRLCDVYEKQLGDIDAAKQTLLTFLEKFPDTGQRTALEKRIEHIGEDVPEIIHDASLASLEEITLQEEAEEETESTPEHLTLAPLEDEAEPEEISLEEAGIAAIETPIQMEDEEDEEPESRPAAAPEFAIEALDEMDGAIENDEDDDLDITPSDHSSLDPL